MLSQLGKSFDLLEIFSPFFVKARLVLQRLAIEKYDWYDDVPESIVIEGVVSVVRFLVGHFLS